jgi:hypothetical protein
LLYNAGKYVIVGWTLPWWLSISSNGKRTLHSMQFLITAFFAFLFLSFLFTATTAEVDASGSLFPAGPAAAGSSGSF